MTWLETLTRLAEPFAHVYNSSKVLSNGTTYAHLASMLGAGGLALGADRQVLRLQPDDRDGLRRHLADAASLHQMVLVGLALAAVTGMMMFASDVETFAVSRLYWTKIGSVALLAANGGRLVTAERRLAADPADIAAWRRLRGAALASIVLWFTVTLVGTLLTTEA